MAVNNGKRNSRLEEEEVSHDPILQRLAKSDTFDSDWPTLRHHLHLALLSVLPVFNSLPAPPKYPYPPATPDRPINSDTPPTPSPVSAKTSPVTSTAIPTSSLLLSRSPSSSSSSTTSTSDDKPSTIGGLVIPPFPPLDPERRSRRKLSAGSIGPVPPAVVARMNGHQGGGLLGRGNVFEDEWDEAVVIGGKKLPGWLEDEEGKKEIERLGKILDELEEPPFTIQRLAELLLNPTKHHTTLGKFIRALEKNLLVTTTWTAPSYVAVPPSTFSGSRGLYGPTSAPSASSPGSSSGDTNSTMPIGATTPMFSPIPFLLHPPPGNDMDVDIDEDDERVDSGLRRKEESMSPLLLSTETKESEVIPPIEQQTLDEPITLSPSRPKNGRSQTPEPEDTTSHQSSSTPVEPISPIPAPTPVLTGTESSDPGHQPYLGRVDELDTGPLVSKLPSASPSPSNGNADQGEGMGTGEGGNMTPHGMSERPVPISATTVVEEGERKVAGLPRSKSALSLAETAGDEEMEKTEEVVDVKEEAKGEEVSESELLAKAVDAETEAMDDKMEIEGDKMEVEVEVSTATEKSVPGEEKKISNES